MMTNEKNVANLLVVRTSAATADMEDTNVNNHVSNLNVGEPVIIRPGGVVVNAVGLTAANTPAIKIGTRLSSGSMNWSDIIEAKDVKSVTALRSALPRQQLDYIGYNGTAGAIDVVANNLYSIRLYLNPLDTAGWMQQFIKRATYQSTVADTQLTITRGLAKSLIANLSREVDKQKYGIDRIGIHRTYSGAQANALATATAALTKGSKYVVFSEDLTALVTAGTILRFGATGAGVAPVYVCVGHNGAAAAARVYELDIPWQGVTTAALAAASVESAAAGGNWGIAITGVAYTSDPPKFFYQIPRWTTTIEGFTTTTVTNSVVPFEGRGTRDQVRELEQQLLGSEGNFYRAQVPYPTFRSETVAGVQYAWIIIEYVDNMTSHLGQSAISHKQLYIAVDRVNGGTINDANTGLGTVLDAWITAHGIALNTAITAEVVQAAIV